MRGALLCPAYGTTQKLPAEVRQLRPPILISIKLQARRGGLELCCRGLPGLSPYANFFVRLFFRYDYGAHRRRDVADQLTHHLNVRKRASQFPSCNRSDTKNYGHGNALGYAESRYGPSSLFFR